MTEGIAGMAEAGAGTTPAAGGAAEAAPFEVINPAGRAPVVLVCDHAGPRIPADLDALGLDRTILQRHIAWDIGALEVARRLSERFDAPLVASNFSRLIIDPNRHPDDPTSIPVISDGVVVPGNRGLAPAERSRRAAQFFHPYHQAIDRVLQARADAGAVPALVSVHSFTPVFRGFERPWHFGILWARDPRIALPLLRRLAAEDDLTVGDNQPYSGQDNFGYTVEVHASETGLPHLLVEVRQDLVDTRHGAREWADRLADALEPCLEPAPGLYAVRHF